MHGLVLVALAQVTGDGIDTHLFRPALDSRGIVSVNGVDVVGGGRTSLGLVLDYGRGLLRAPSGPSIENSFTGTFQFNYGVADRAAVGLSVPVVLMSGPGLDLQAFQHVALHGKLKLTRPASGIGLALAGQVGLPVSNAPKSAAADPSLWYWPMLIAEKRFGANEPFRIAMNAGYRGHAASDTSIDLAAGRVRDGSRITYGAGASFRIADPIDLLAETYGTYLLSEGAARASNEALGGVKIFVDKSSYLVLGAGTRITSGFEAADVRATVGFIFEPPAGETDGGGVRETAVDTDGDGIPDADDACPYVKGVRTNNPRTNGCPPLVEHPPVIIEDRDHDGIADAEDACPDTWGRPSADPKRNGCPLVDLGPGGLILFEKIRFETASAKILPESNPILDDVATALREHPELTLVEIAGHADERGSAELNLRLTQARVDSVVRALVERNVERARLRARGYGFYCPLEEGHDETAWSKNRRVEFLIVTTKDGPTDTPLGCANAARHGVKP